MLCTRERVLHAQSARTQGCAGNGTTDTILMGVGAGAANAAACDSPTACTEANLDMQCTAQL